MDFLIPLQTKRPSVAPAGMEAAEWGLTLQRGVTPCHAATRRREKRRRGPCDDDAEVACAYGPTQLDASQKCTPPSHRNTVDRMCVNQKLASGLGVGEKRHGGHKAQKWNNYHTRDM